MLASIEICKKIINNANKIALFCHIRPDGDTLGAALALKLALQKSSKTIDVYCEDDVPEKFLKLGFDGHFLNDSLNNPNQYDLLVAIDCGDIGRMGKYGDLFIKSHNTLAIDHHATHTKFCKNTCVFEYSSTCEIIFELIKELNIQLDDNIAKALYVGLSTDTGNFRHNNTTQKTFNTAEQLACFNLDISELNRILYNETTYSRQKLLGRALTNMRKYFDGKVCLIYLTEKDFADACANMTHTDGFTDYAINVDTAQIGICISQNTKNSYKISMRSKKINVAEICEYFGGGGHVLAAGCVICGFLEDVIDKIIRILEDIKWTDL
ncbi:MAG: bifunctional oligoribonuclease/PAP phosphatase NrnA [Clostridia bacterium]|nr:bifunctional oligoribonuclease/PAP phosphatase NrnA [Clostridia bacterium]